MALFMSPEAVKVADVRVPTRLRPTLDPKKVDELAADIAANGMKTPIQVRRDKQSFVLVTGLHRLEAARALGEETIQALIVHAPLR